MTDVTMPTRRPWETALDGSLWELTGTYPNGGWFIQCLAVAVPSWASGSDRPLFKWVHPTLDRDELIDPAWITSAAPMRLARRDDEPVVRYNPDDVEDCGACDYLDDTCPYHEGVTAGVELAARAMRALADE